MENQEKVTLRQGGQEQAAPLNPPTWDVPVSSVALPSGGKIYPVESALHGREHVDIRSMTAREEDILTSRSLLKQGKAMSMLIKNCVVDKSVDPDDMLVGDRNAILVSIRASGYGAQYEAKFECPVCETQFESTVDLSALKIKTLGADPIVPGENRFQFTLPMSQNVVVFKLLTGAQERELQTSVERARKAKGVGAIESGVTSRLAFHIVSMNGETDRTKIQRLIATMPAGDSKKLREHIDTVSPGLDMMVHITCPACNDEAEVDVPIGADFFWPGA